MLIFLKEKTEFTKKGEIHELFVLALSLVWFAGAPPDFAFLFVRDFFVFPGSKDSWSRRHAERIWGGEFFILARQILGELPANFSANFDGEF